MSQALTSCAFKLLLVTRPGYNACGVPVEDYTGNEARQVGRRSRMEHLPQSVLKFLFTLGKTTTSPLNNVRAMGGFRR